jgi:hypothetical protein
MKQKMDYFKSEMTALNKELQDAKSANSLLESELRNTRLQAKLAVSRLKKGKGSAESGISISAPEEMSDGLSIENERLKVEIQQLNDELLRLKQMAESSSQSLKEIINQKDIEIQSFKKQLTVATGEHDQSSLEKELETARMQLNVLQTKFESLIQDKDAQIEALKKIPSSG